LHFVLCFGMVKMGYFGGLFGSFEAAVLQPAGCITLAQFTEHSL
jgi:hypothetical protein